MRSHPFATLPLCVATTSANPRSCCNPRRSSNTEAPVPGSRLPVGSSARTIAGPGATARAIATRCCSPPDSADGRWDRPIRETQTHQHLPRRTPTGPPAASDPERHLDVFERVNSGSRWWNWNINPTWRLRYSARSPPRGVTVSRPEKATRPHPGGRDHPGCGGGSTFPRRNRRRWRQLLPPRRRCRARGGPRAAALRSGSA